MSKLATAGGDDHPEAAEKHLLDSASLLESERFDGAAYLSGYVVECSLKSLVLLEKKTMKWGGKDGHDIAGLSECSSMLATVAGTRTARYFGVNTANAVTSSISAWRPEMRYRPETKDEARAREWHRIADAVFTETIAQLYLDGVL